MSKTIISVEKINSVNEHPNADRLEIVQVLGYQVVTQKGSFKVGDIVVYFPPDILLPQDVAERLEVTQYLKHAMFPGTDEKSQCRVGAARLRSVSSYGFVVPITSGGELIEIGADLTEAYGAHKYVAPVRSSAGDAEPELPAFHKYTSIENIQRYPDAFDDFDGDVVISEKIHGSNCRVGLVRDKDGDFVFCAGSHNVRRKHEGSLYWEFMNEKMMKMLTSIANQGCGDDPCHDVIVFGEIFGPGVQDMQYGLAEKSFRVFDISVNGRYMDYYFMVDVCELHGILTVPELFMGQLEPDCITRCTDGATKFGGVKEKFKGREGCVVRPSKKRIATHWVGA